MATILTSNYRDDIRRNPILTKRFTAQADGTLSKSDYDQAYTFDATHHAVGNIHDLSAMLTMLEGVENSCVVRAQTTGATEGIRRKLYNENGGVAPLRDNPNGLKWLMFDFDKLPVESYGFQTPEERLAYLVSELPQEFHDVSYHYQWSSSAGLDGWQTLSAHLWYFLDQPWFCRTLYERFHDGDFRDIPVDSAPYTSNQIHYTARPIFVGSADPVEQRSGLVLRGSDTAKLRPFIRPVVVRPEMTPMQHYESFGLKRFGDLLGEIGPNYHRPILRAVAHYCAVVPAAQFDRLFLEMSLAEAIHGALPGKSRKSDYTNRSYLNRVIAGAQRKFGGF